MKFKKLSQKYLLFLSVLLIIALSGCTVPISSNNDIILTIYDLSGEELFYSLDNLKDDYSVSGYGSFVKTGAPETPLPISGPYYYNGFNITKIIEDIHGYSLDFNLVATASDDYQMTFTRDQILGYFYNYEEDTVTKKMQRLTPILAYESSDDMKLEPLRLVIIDPQDGSKEEAPITEGHFWVKNVVKLEITYPEDFWEINLIGAINRTMDRNEFESGASCDTHNSIWEENDTIYEGLPLWVLVSLIDDVDDTGRFHYNFNYTRAANNYSIILKSKDGTEFILNSIDVLDSYNNAETKFTGLLLIYKLNGSFLPEPLNPLCLRGSMVSDDQKIDQIIEIRLEGLPGE